MQATYAAIELGKAGLFGLRLKVEKLNKRADKHGMNKLEVRVIRELVVDTDNEGNPCIPETRYEVEIIGTAPVIDGWALGARIEFNPTVGTIVRVAPGAFAELDYSAYRTHEGDCDHCNTKRRRNDVFVLIDSIGTHKVVGRNCLADFIRNGDAESFARFAVWCEEIATWSPATCEEEAHEGGYGSGARFTESLQAYLTAAALVIRRLGWTSVTEARKMDLTATVSDINQFLYSRGPSRQRFIAEHNLIFEPRDAELAETVIDWAKGLQDLKSEYLYTIHKIAMAGAVDSGLMGFAASMIRAYQRENEVQVERANKNKVFDFVGSVGERFKGLPVRVVRIRYIDGNYGVRTIVAMETTLPDGKIAPIVWFASGEQVFTEGDEYSLVATVKGHENDKYGKQTVVTRAKLTR